MKYHILSKVHVFVLTLAVVSVTIAHAENHHSLTPLLVDLPGWEAEKPEVMSMDMGAMKMTNATRSYTKDNKEITAVVMLGNNAMTQGQMVSRYILATTRMRTQAQWSYFYHRARRKEPYSSFLTKAFQRRRH